MLVLSRKSRQQIRIGENITVTILLVKGQVVRVGIDAPREVRVLRAELPAFDESAADETSPSNKTIAPAQNETSSDACSPVKKSAHKRVDDSVARTSPNLLELRRRGSLSSLSRHPVRSSAQSMCPLVHRQ